MPDIVVHRVTYEDTVTTQPIPHGEEYVEEVQDPEGQYIHEILAPGGRRRHQRGDHARQICGRRIYVSSEVVNETGADACAEHHI